MLLFLFVDDMQVAFHKEDEREWEEAHMQLKRRFNITNLGESKFMLGMRITRDRRSEDDPARPGAVHHQGTREVRPGPVQDGAHTRERQASSTRSPLEDREGASSQPTDLKLYQEKVGTLLYAAISTRPDIAFAVNKLAQNMQAPTVAHAKACDRVLRYLAGTEVDRPALRTQQRREGHLCQRVRRRRLGQRPHRPQVDHRLGHHGERRSCQLGE